MDTPQTSTTDPAPYINPATMERTSFPTSVSIHQPRKVWPQHGGRMVRRDYLRPGDRAVSSHYGPRIVAEVNQHGTEGQTTQIIWETPESSSRLFSELYDSHLMIELLPDHRA